MGRELELAILAGLVDPGDDYILVRRCSKPSGDPAEGARCRCVVQFEPDVILLHSVAAFTWLAAPALRCSDVPVLYVDHGTRASDLKQEQTVIGAAHRVVS